jgi:two-component system, cell cycle sensor histidine kinase and response regulator CckA
MNTLLVVDDNPQNLYLLQVLLSTHGFEVDSASNGSEALERAHRSPPDMIISDILMPVMDGFSLCRAWKQDDRLKSIPFVFYTATYTDPKDEEFGLSLGADKFIVKPVEPDRLVSLIRETWNNFREGKPNPHSQPVQDAEYHEKYNAALIRKLEDKMVQLEETNRTLERDIAERKRVESALRENEAKMRGIMDNIGIGIAVVGPNLEILELNHRMHDWFQDVRLGQPSLCHRMSGDPIGLNRFDDCSTCRTIRDGRVHEMTVQTGEGGQTRTYRIVSTPIIGTHGEIAAAIEMVEDVTERISLESQVRQAQKMEAVGQLAGGIAHDFNNLLTVILGHTELALLKTEDTHPLHVDLRAILDVSNRCSAIIRQLLAFARKQTITPVVLNLNKSVEGMIKVIRRLIGEDIHLVWRPCQDVWLVKIDPTQVEQILANLCVNARDAIEGVGTITIEAGNVVLEESFCVKHPGVSPGQYAMLSVSDTGCGMDAETLGRIFEPFFTTKELGRGTGLGLSTVYGIIRQNNGFIDARSEIANGTTFKIYLARHPGEATEAGKQIEESLPLSAGETVLVVEDEVLVLELAGGILDRLGYIALTAGSPGEAMRLADQHPGEIHLLITDVILPDMTGRELTEHIQKRRPAIKYLYMSGYSIDVVSYRGMLERDAPFIMKPFSVKELATKVRSVLD